MYAMPCSRCNVTFLYSTYPALSTALQRHMLDEHDVMLIEILDSET